MPEQEATPEQIEELARLMVANENLLTSELAPEIPTLEYEQMGENVKRIWRHNAQFILDRESSLESKVKYLTDSLQEWMLKAKKEQEARRAFGREFELRFGKLVAKAIDGEDIVEDSHLIIKQVEQFTAYQSSAPQEGEKGE